MTDEKEHDEDFIQRVQAELDCIVDDSDKDFQRFVQCPREEYERLLILASLAVYSGMASNG